MLQTANATQYGSWPSASVPVVSSPEVWKEDLPGKLTRSNSSTDVALLYSESVVVSSDSFAWQDIRLVQLRVQSLILPGSDSHCLLLNLGAAINVVATVGKRAHLGRVGTGEVATIPAGTSFSSEATGSHVQNVVLLYLRPLFVRSLLSKVDFSGAEMVLTPEVGFRCTHIRHIAMSLLGELREAHLLGRLYADSLAQGLAMQLIRRFSTLRDVQIGVGGMAPHRLRKALALIDHHLTTEEEGRVALRVVAKEVGVSYFHFSRAFKQTIGMSPTTYIAERRMEHAKKLMVETAMPISEIALRSGFSSQSHFTTAFRRYSGVTPRSFRKGI